MGGTLRSIELQEKRCFLMILVPDLREKGTLVGHWWVQRNLNNLN